MNATTPSLTVTIGGETRTYPRSKEGKRQAIVDGLASIETVTVDEDTYLPDSAALQVVAAVLYPDGIQTREAYQIVQDVTGKACAHLGFGPAEALEPPLVPFANRGMYRKRYPPVDAALVLEELEMAGTSSTYPRQELLCAAVWNRAGRQVYDLYWDRLTPGQQTLIQAQVDAIAAQAGWTQEEARYVRLLAVDAAAARMRLAQHVRREEGRPVSASGVIYQAQVGAYGRSFYSHDLPPALQALVSETLQAHGYRPTPVEGMYQPLPVALAVDALDSLPEKLAALQPVCTTLGEGLLLADVLAVVARPEQAVSPWQAEQLVEDGRVSQVLRQMGYRTELTWCQPLRQAQGKLYHFQPKPADDQARQVLLKEVRVQNEPQKKLSLAKGLAVFMPAVAIDDGEDTLVYLEMVGVKQAVKANWAALVGGHACWIGRKRVHLEGMKAHVKIQATLPCGWASHILIHKQASLKAMNPEQPFYLLDDGKRPALSADDSRPSRKWSVPPLFYPMLNKCLALPLLPEWAGYLWEHGRGRSLITLLDDGEGQGYAAWRVLPAPKEWEAVVQAGLRGGELTF